MTEITDKAFFGLNAGLAVKQAAGDGLNDSPLLKELKAPYASEDIKRKVFEEMVADVALVGHYLGFVTVRGPVPDEDGKCYTWKPHDGITDAIFRSGPDRQFLNSPSPKTDLFFGVRWEFFDDPKLAGQNLGYVPTGDINTRGPSPITGPAFTPYVVDKDSDQRWDSRTHILFDNIHVRVISREVGQPVTSDPVTEVITTKKLDNSLGSEQIASSLSLTYTRQSSCDVASSVRCSDSFSWQLGASETANFGDPAGMFARASVTLSESLSDTTSVDKTESKSENTTYSESRTETFTFTSPPHTRTVYEVTSEKTSTTAVFSARVVMNFAVIFKGKLRCAFEERLKGTGNYHIKASGIHQFWEQYDFYEYRLGDAVTPWWKALANNFKNNIGDYDLRACAEQNPEFRVLLEKISSDDYQKRAEFTIDGALGYAERNSLSSRIISSEVSME